MKFDHAVYFSNRTPQEDARLWNDQGMSAAPGGSHEKWGTQNALFYAKNGYIESLSVERPEMAAASTHPLTRLLMHDLQNGAGWGTVCLRPGDLYQFDERLRSRGFRTTGVLDASRRTVSGELLEWKMLFIEEGAGETLPFPFFIDWGMPDDERIAGLLRTGTMPEANRSFRIGSCTFQVHDPARTAVRWAEVLGLDAPEADRIPLKNGVDLVFVQGGAGPERLVDVEVIQETGN
ncbi:VOC family protein [Edaphobacillus lindanitolerans]|uniref:Glyoxalase-like domain-containing protein n=1 Tax=Edaphobacillus lindanitolerans TaxID=550447 RepID=A0A1U7PM06_9BACI|nr:VOC family protein [Edaphobacillus lindanitolerans]SIT88931.1 Glyoxalase-like domain-containing protein [Edaphobacillus lindanitolerans]